MKKTIEQPLSLRELVDAISAKQPGITQVAISKALGKGELYLSQQLHAEKNGKPYSKKLVRDLEKQYEGILKGTKTTVGTQEEILKKILDELTYLKAGQTVLFREMAMLKAQNHEDKVKKIEADLASQTADLAGLSVRFARSLF
jgi:hypothetical protein